MELIGQQTHDRFLLRAELMALVPLALGQGERHQPGEGGVLTQELEGRVQLGAEPCLGRGGPSGQVLVTGLRGAGLLHDVLQFSRPVHQHLPDQLVLGSEVVIHRPFGHLGDPRQLIDRMLLNAPVIIQRHHRVKNPHPCRDPATGTACPGSCGSSCRAHADSSIGGFRRSKVHILCFLTASTSTASPSTVVRPRAPSAPVSIPRSAP